MNNIRTRQGYCFIQENLFGELIFNGENPYAIKRLTLASNAKAQYYQQSLFETFKTEKFDDEILTKKVDLGFNPTELGKEISNRPFYVLELEDLRDLYTSEPFVNRARIQSLRVVKEVETKLQFPYAVFVKARNRETNWEGFICIAAVFYYTTANKYVTISPFFAKVVEAPKLWPMVRCHIALVHFNDFTFKIHLGVLHLISSQYNVPLYNFLHGNKKFQSKLTKFFKFAFEPFNRGLEGVNTTALKTLIHPEHPILSNVFTLSTNMAIKLIETHSETLDLNRYNPVELAKKNGLSEFLDIKTQSEIYYDNEIYKVMTEYITFVYNEIGMKEVEDGLLKEINDTITKD